MVEQAWLDEDDVVVNKIVLDNFEKMQQMIKWINDNYPEIIDSYNKQKG